MSLKPDQKNTFYWKSWLNSLGKTSKKFPSSNPLSTFDYLFAVKLFGT